jgi:3-oxoacyl-[acyl-carrier protein] reductase
VSTALAGKSALVTGGTRGIGRAIVERLARDGAAVTFSYRTDRRAADDVVRMTNAASGGSVRTMQADQGDGAAIIALFEAAEQHGGGIDIVVNNAAA